MPRFIIRALGFTGQRLEEAQHAISDNAVDEVGHQATGMGLPGVLAWTGAQASGGVCEFVLQQE
jgi:hypothetical protein